MITLHHGRSGMDSKSRTRCEGCVYWRKLSYNGGVPLKACHCLLDTERRRVEKDGVCLSKKKIVR